MTNQNPDNTHADNPALPPHASAQIAAMTGRDRLRRCVDDILTITALPTTWIGKGLDDIGKRLLDVVGPLLNVDFLVLRIAARQGERSTNITWFGRLAGLDDASGFRHDLIAMLGDVTSTLSATTLQWGTSTFSCVLQELNANIANGALVAGTRESFFPDEEDRVILRVAAIQAAVAIGQAFKLRDDNQAAIIRERNRIDDAIPLMAWFALPDGRADHLNTHFLGFLGYTREQAIGWNWMTALHPDDATTLKDTWLALLRSGRAGEAEARLRGCDGDYKWFLFRANPSYAEDGSLAGWYGTNTDIDDRKRTEEELRKSAAFLAQGQELTQTGSVWWRPSTDEIQWSDQAYRVAGLPVTQKPTVTMMFDRCHPEDLAQVRELISRAAHDGMNVDLEHRLLMPNGEIKYVHVVLQNIGLNAADPEFIGAVTDITARTIAERTLRRSEVLLAEGQRISLTGTFSWKVDTDELTFSDELNRIFGFDQNTVIDFDKIAARVYEEDLGLLAKKMAEVRSGGDNPDYDIRLFVDGRMKYVRVVGRIVQHLDGTTECIGAVQDVSAQRLAEQARDKLRSDLAQLARAMSLSTMVASIAHEVNQPLAGIITNASTSLLMLSQTPPDVSGAMETARRTIRDGNRAADVIVRLRNLFRRGVATVEPLDLNVAAREVIALLTNDMQRGRISLHSELSDSLPLIVGDRVQLQQVIMNLLRNSIEAMADISPSSRSILVRTEAEDDGGVKLTVSDTGCGLATLETDRLFDAFRTTKPDGMGIGLSVSRSIVEAHGGKIWATSGSAGGAIFGFSIRARRTQDSPCSKADR
ncbi:PAS domain-containing protein [Rhizobium sp. WYJ-E13]|uniref:PAS domain-containing sensor histidine kinase n=1 Tax=Rhizobium sp. WYJ-E13 TaxID=2849093 RepID=UPI001C1EBEB8|nr:PAS domain-containing protein [Rhizobium sp. WYJ-E13]QWW70513.1 PAS domain-containing protein [Rhizobium sp. WYJ-E13]